MGYYIIIGIIIVLLNLFYYKRKWSIIGYSLLYVLLLIFSAARDLSVGTDYNRYNLIFNSIGENTYNQTLKDGLILIREVGFYYANMFFYLIGNFSLYSFVFYTISYYLIFKSYFSVSTIFSFINVTNFLASSSFKHI